MSPNPAPQPNESEIECGNCGAYFYYELTRCPNCGINLYEPEAIPPDSPGPAPRENWLRALLRRLTNQPHPADELFGAAMNQAEQFNNLLAKVGGDRAVAERLIAFERQKDPQATRAASISRAIERWQRDNGLN